MLCPKCQRWSFTPIQNNRYNFGFVMWQDMKLLRRFSFHDVLLREPTNLFFLFIFFIICIVSEYYANLHGKHPAMTTNLKRVWMFIVCLFVTNWTRWTFMGNATETLKLSHSICRSILYIRISVASVESLPHKHLHTQAIRKHKKLLYVPYAVDKNILQRLTIMGM
jgi:hypothetical protein